jgi:tripartite-type tricarboxylate transporter receptor subunit TctC
VNLKKTLARLSLLLAGALPLTAPMQVQAQGYPSKPIRMVVPYVAGGAADITARVVGQKMSESMGVPVLIDNRAGANGNIGTDMVAKAAPDGYTVLLVASGPIVVNPSLYGKLPYDPVKDLAPVSQIASYQYALIVPAASPLRSVADIVQAAKARPDSLSYGSTGIGGGGHLAGELFGVMTGTHSIHVPYKGAAPALADLLAGQLSFIFDTVVTTAPQLAAGKVRAFAVSGPKRAGALPQLPTMAELGYQGFDITQFQGLLVPAKTDKAIVERLHAEVVKALKQPEVIQRLGTEGGNELVGGTPAEFARQITSDLALYARLIKSANVKAE